MINKRFSFFFLLFAKLAFTSAFLSTPCFSLSSDRNFLTQQLLPPSASTTSSETNEASPIEVIELTKAPHNTAPPLFVQSSHPSEKLPHAPLPVVITETPTVHCDVTSPSALGRVPVAHGMGASIEPVLEIHPETVTLTPSRSSEVIPF